MHALAYGARYGALLLVDTPATPLTGETFREYMRTANPPGILMRLN